MTRTKGDYEIGCAKPPRECGFKKGNPVTRAAGRRVRKTLTTLLNDALNETVTITENGRRRKITKREASSSSWSTNPPRPRRAR